jgi:hypothetical protein
VTKSAFFVVSAVACSSLSVFTQSQQPVHAPDGGTRQMLTSIAVPPLANAPFSATVNTEWTRYLENGATLILKNRRLIARDGQGRVFQERRFLAADGNPQQSRLTSVEIADPSMHTIASCDPDQQVCELRFYGVTAVPALPPAGATPNGNLTRETLGTQTDSGFETVGTRETLTMNGAAVGADRPLSIVKEFWYAPRLGVNLSTKRTDPRSGVEVFAVTDVNPSEPDPQLFALPTGAKIIDRRSR